MSSAAYSPPADKTSAVPLPPNGIVFPELEALWFSDPIKKVEAKGKSPVLAMRCAPDRSSTRYYLIESLPLSLNWYKQPLDPAQQAAWHKIPKVALAPQELGYESGIDAYRKSMFYVKLGEKEINPFRSQPGIWGENRVFVDTKSYPKTNEFLPPRAVHIDQGPEAEDMQDPYTSEEEEELRKRIVETIKGLEEAHRGGGLGMVSGADDWNKEGRQSRG
jgi:hypothetical protein